MNDHDWAHIDDDFGPNATDVLADNNRLHAEVSLLTGQRTAALLLHCPTDAGVTGLRCRHCFDGDGEPLSWPCPTVKALGGIPDVVLSDESTGVTGGAS